jgi:phosphomannomutase
MYLSDYLERIYNEYGTYYNKRIDIEVSPDKKYEIINYFLSLKNKKIENIKITDVSDKDGAKVIFKNKSWLLVRASGTEPLIRCYIESKDKDYFNILQKFTAKIIKDLQDKN